MRILLATDNHLGFMEKDPVRSNDSFEAFEEILQIAQQQNVDFILLGGDLFHDNRPSRKTLHKTMEMLRHYCHGQRVVDLEILSDQSVNFPNRFAVANFMDENMNIGMPVFSIHGNHDDPSGDGNLCALDLLSAAGLVNYFGKSREIEHISVAPIFLVKGDTKLALYGLGNIRDERLFRIFNDGKVSMLRPEDSDEWFNLLVLHQNRVAHGPTNYVPERFIDSFFDLVFWGHEHECVIDAAYNPDQQFYVTQPGSSVATSLSEGESRTKHVGIVTITGKKFQLDKIRLTKVRPFAIEDLVLRDIVDIDPNNIKEVEKYLKIKIERMIAKARKEWLDTNASDENDADDALKPPLPLIRLRVEYSGETFNTYNRQRFGRMFTDKVANPNDLLQLYRKRTVQTRAKPGVKGDFAEPGMPEPLDVVQLETLVGEFLKAQNLELLPENELNDAVKIFVEKDDKDAIKEFVDKSLDKTRSRLKKLKEIVREDEILKEVEKERKLNEAKATEYQARQSAAMHPISTVVGDEEQRDSNSERQADFSPPAQSSSHNSKENAWLDDVVASPKAPARSSAKTGRGRGRGRGTAKAAAKSSSGRGRAKKAETSEEEMDDQSTQESDDALSEEYRNTKTPRSSVQPKNQTAVAKRNFHHEPKTLAEDGDSDVILVDESDECDTYRPPSASEEDQNTPPVTKRKAAPATKAMAASKKPAKKQTTISSFTSSAKSMLSTQGTTAWPPRRK